MEKKQKMTIKYNLKDVIISKIEWYYGSSFYQMVYEWEIEDE